MVERLCGVRGSSSSSSIELDESIAASGLNVFGWLMFEMEV